MKLGRRGQGTTEYLLLLCMATTVAIVTGAFLKHFVPDILDRVLDKMLEVAIRMASP